VKQVTKALLANPLTPEQVQKHQYLVPEHQLV